MRPKVVAAILGIAMILGGIGFLAYGVLGVTGGRSSSEGAGDACLDDLSAVGFPAGIMGIVFGMIIAGWALSSLRDERGTRGPLRAFGFMTGLGTVFIAMAAIFVLANQGTDDGTFLFVGGLFAIMGLA